MALATGAAQRVTPTTETGRKTRNMEPDPGRATLARSIRVSGTRIITMVRANGTTVMVRGTRVDGTLIYSMAKATICMPMATSTQGSSRSPRDMVRATGTQYKERTMRASGSWTFITE